MTKGVGQGHLPLKRSHDFLIEVAKGNIPGHSIIHKFGHATVGTTLTPICHGGFYPTPTTAISLEALSGDDNDTLLGTGARTIFLEGLALDGSIVTQTISMNGQTPVPIPIPLFRLYRWFVETSGTYATTAVGSHAGVITVRVAGGGAVWSSLDTTPFAHGQSEIGWYTVPAEHRALVFLQEINVDTTKSADVVFVRREGANIVTAPFSPMRVAAQYVGVAGSNPSDSNAPQNHFEAFADIGYMGKVSNGTASISVAYEILLVQDGY
jgi:hypothetical protein